jgi:HAD superfamily hydrolase (TIGR01509 family)
VVRKRLAPTARRRRPHTNRTPCYALCVIDCAALVFDMDGLMVDSEPLWFAVEREFARVRGGEWTQELALTCVGQGTPHTLREMNRIFGFAVDVERDARAVAEMFILRVQELALKPGFEELLAAGLGAGLPCAVASSSARKLVEATLRRFGVLDRFHAVTTGNDVERHKPAPDVFLLAAERLGVPPAACIVLEDSMAGVRAARAAGMRVVAVPERDAERFAGLADAVVDDLHGARAWLGL